MAAALAARLEQLLHENEMVREKVMFLEDAMQDLTVELEEKKMLLSTFTGSSPNKSGRRGSGATASLLSEAARRQSPEAIERVLETTLEENKRLKRDLRTMGEELAACGQGDPNRRYTADDDRARLDPADSVVSL